MDGLLLNITSSRASKRKRETSEIIKEPPIKNLNIQNYENSLETAISVDGDDAHSQKKLSNKQNMLSSTDQSFQKDAPEIISYPKFTEPMEICPVADEGVVMSSTSETLFSPDSFSSLSLHPFLVKNLADKLGCTKITVVQKVGIPTVQKGVDVLVKSQTGSGKTLVYALPVVNNLGTMDPPVQRSDGVFCLVILPTRELAVQSFDVFHHLCTSFIRITPGCLSGGERKKSEKARIRKGINILVSTPGRLIDHLKTSEKLKASLSQIKYLVIDEADRLLEAGFENQIGDIFRLLTDAVGDRKWQTILLSATLTPAVERLASLSLKNPEFVDVQALSAASTQNIDSFVMGDPIMSVPEKLKQFYAVTPTKLKLAAMTTFLLRLRKHKIVIFAPTQDIVEFLFSLYENAFGRLITELEITESTDKINLFRLHGEMTQSERSDVFRKFSQAEGGFLLSTDVAARGLDLPSITWVVQFQAPESPAIYVHRIGRTARAGRPGSSILFMLPNENAYVKLMRQDYGMNMRSIKFSAVTAGLMESQSKNVSKGSEIDFIFKVQHVLDSCIQDDTKLNEMARKAYISFVRAYATYRNEQRDIFNVRNGLHFGHIARSFGLKDDAPTKINEILRRNTSTPHYQKRIPRQNSHEAKETSSSSYPSWKGSSFHKQQSGFSLQNIAKSVEKMRKGTTVISGKRAGGREGYKVAMQRFSEFSSEILKRMTEAKGENVINPSVYDKIASKDNSKKEIIKNLLTSQISVMEALSSAKIRPSDVKETLLKSQIELCQEHRDAEARVSRCSRAGRPSLKYAARQDSGLACTCGAVLGYFEDRYPGHLSFP